jgi:amino acid adenylation domain-containing protein
MESVAVATGLQMPPDEWNETSAPYKSDRCIHQLVEEQASRTPEATALVTEDERLSYDDLNARANRLAHYLISLGVSTETLVGLCVRRGADMLVAVLGILKAGGAYIPIDPAYPKVRQSFIAADSAMPVLITQSDLIAELPPVDAKLVSIDGDRAAIDAMPSTNPDAPVTPRNLVNILYTSGSTGQPKGVAIEHLSIVNYMCWAQTKFLPEEIAGVFLGSSICFDLSVFEIFVPLTGGGAIILGENLLAVPTLKAREEITFINSVPSAINALVGIDGVPRTVKVVTLAGELLNGRLMQDILRIPTIEKLYNMWGPCETTIHNTIYLCQRGATQNPPIGKPFSNQLVYILDENNQRTAIGVPGEICLGGDGLARGYWNRPEMTAAKFIENPFGPGRIYRTGDLGRFLPDGNIEFVGRVDNQVKIRGFRVELGEIETALEQHPAVKRAIVLAVPDAKSDRQLVAYLVTDTEVVKSLGEIVDATEKIEIWKALYNETYSKSAEVSEDLTLNTGGWASSYTDGQIPDAEMKEWVEQTVERMLALQPKNLLELGCGTGMLLARVAPTCDSYVGFDISGTALDNIRALQQRMPGLERISLFERAAHELEGFEPGSFDTVVINSVIQLFPDIDYLVGVIHGLMPLVKPGGHILLGDLINHATLETFQTSLQLFRAKDSDSIGKVKNHIRNEVANERDMAIAPGLFPVLMRQIPEISHVEAMPKRGYTENELSRFRYDVVLHVQSSVETLAGLDWLDWERSKLSVAELRRILTEERPESVAIRRIPNGRLDEEVAAMSWLRDATAQQSAAQWRAYVKAQPDRSVQPEDLWALAELGYRVEISWLNTDSDGAFDAVFYRSDLPERHAVFAVADDDVRRPVGDFCNHPQRAKLNRQLIPHLRQLLREKVPHYMMPAVFTVLDKFPLSPNGKIDRKALEQLPVTIDSGAEESRAVTDNPTEKLLLELWADVLNVGHVGLDQNFFELGGNSLTAVALMHRLQKTLNRSLGPVVLMQSPTIKELAAYLDQTAADATPAAPEPVEVEEGEI